MPCGVAGCAFAASGKVVKEHKLSAHPEGGAAAGGGAGVRRAPSAAEAEELRRYRAERAKHYPSTANLERKARARRWRTRFELLARGRFVTFRTI